MKKKVGLVVGYNGEGYCGLQFNKDTKTIEREIVKILLKNECITEMNSHDAQKIDLKSSSRTDKGVHASFNLISVKIIKEPTEELFKKLKNDFIKVGINLYKIVVLPKSFLCYKQARSRIYKYTVPTYFLKESNFENEWKELKASDEATESNLANKTSKNDLSDCMEQDYQEKVRNLVNESNLNRQSVFTKEKYEMREDTEESDKREGFFRTYTDEDILPIKGYKSDSIQKFREIMNLYVGTHNFHNFTLKRVPGDVRRYMVSIEVSEPFYNEEIEYVEVIIHGQSFLLHQIRKMISYAVLNCRFARDNFKENFKKALSAEDVHVPKCPSQYLFLNHIFFDDFNKKRLESGLDTIDLDEKQKESFERENIYPSILTTDNLYEWLKYFDAVRFHHDRFDQYNY